ncbi:MAG: hypothetical protein BM556_14470 [Bacteriovorax sp. MedPE-SWde]|nr:MAG: hypothetical protein BM556_14470 [Bacteriovorax sp. MedPE-SWde]
MNNPKLEYFYYDACPFCQMVKSVINQLNVKLEYKNIQEDEASFNRLVADTGRRTVPCLYIDNKPMFESADIINWLQTNIDNLEKNS